MSMEASVTTHEAPIHHVAKPDTIASQGSETLKDITAGSIAGVLGKYVEYPFDTVKVRLQSQPEHLPPRYSGPLDCFRQSIRNDGFLGLYRGVSAPLFGAAVEISSMFFSYRVAQDILQSSVYRDIDEVPLSGKVIAGGMSGAFTSLVLTPIELVKCKMQVPAGSDKAARPGPLSIVASIYRTEGLRAFWRGQLGTLVRETGGSAAWFGVYEAATSGFRSMRLDPKSEESLPVHQAMLAGAAAGMSYNFSFYPADTIKSQMQTEEIGLATGGKRTFFAVGKALYQQQGLAGLYRGCGITVIRSAPSSAIIFTVYEALRKNFL